MALLKIEVEAQVEGLASRLLNVSEALNNKTVLDMAGAFILNRIRTRYLAELAPDGTPWIPSQAGIRRRAKGGTGTLFDTGRLFRSIQLSAESSEDERIISTDVPYAADVHPRWPFMGVNQDDSTILEQILKRAADRILRTGA
jgi:phage gpG-like protein